jgi:hypothetical protein
MVYQDVAKFYAVLVGLLALLGLFTGGHLFSLVNVDGAVDAVRIILFAMLLYAGFFSKSEAVASIVLLFVGAVYLFMGLIALASPTLFGSAPAGLTTFDIGFHLITGAFAAYAGLMGLITQSSISRT